MSNWKDGFYKALIEFVNKNSGDTNKAVEIVSFEQEVYEYGGCETCAYTETVVEITYKDHENKNHTYTYSGNMADLIVCVTDET